MLKIAVIGAGHLGKIHLNILKGMSDYELVGFYDSDIEKASKTAIDLDIHLFSSLEEAIDNADVIDVVTPTISHFACAKMAISMNKHLFIEKPLTKTIAEAEELIASTKNTNLKIQVGHVERFNPSYTAVKESITNPMFIESHRLAQFNPRGTDVSVVLDLMIHDLDIILSSVNANVSSLSASGVKVLSDTPDIANARIQFDNGCVANLTASRISLKNMRKTRFFQNNTYISIDFLDKKSEVITMKDIEGEPDPFALTIDPGNGKNQKEIHFQKPEIKPNNAIQDELQSLYHAVTENTRPIVSLNDGYKALRLAHDIVSLINSTVNKQ